MATLNEIVIGTSIFGAAFVLIRFGIRSYFNEKKKHLVDLMGTEEKEK
jgi:hypothetical protein